MKPSLHITNENKGENIDYGTKWKKNIQCH